MAKDEALRAARKEGRISVHLPLPSLPPPLAITPTIPEALRCQECGGQKSSVTNCLCDRCAVSLPREHVEAHRQYFAYMQAHAPHGETCSCASCAANLLGAYYAGPSGPMINRCPACGGGYTGPPQMPPCPQCKVEAASGVGPYAGSAPTCEMCGEISRGGVARYEGQPICEPCQNAFTQETVKGEFERRRLQGHSIPCGCPECHRYQQLAAASRGGHMATPHFRGPGGRVAPGASHHAVATGGHLFGASSGGPMHRGPLGGLGGVVAGTRGLGGTMPPPGGPRQPEPPRNLEEPDPDRAPDLIEPVLAWRGWNVTADGHLVAAAQNGIWDPGPNRAHCHHNHTDIPAVGCACGFYGWHRTEQIQHGEIWGGLKCWGEIIVHDVGIRAEHAEIVCLVERPGHPMDPHLLARIVDRYKVPVAQSLEEAEKLASKEGILVPASMKPGNASDAAETALATHLQQLVNAGSISMSQARAMLESNPLGGQSAAAAFQQVAANTNAALVSVGASAIKASQGLAAAMKQIGMVTLPLPKPPKPSARDRLALSAAIHVGLVALWALTVATVSIPLWTSFPAGVAIGAIAWWSEAPAVLWRAWRAWRCLIHFSHAGLWGDAPEEVPRDTQHPYTEKSPSAFSAKLVRGERCSYCWRRRRLGR